MASMVTFSSSPVLSDSPPGELSACLVLLGGDPPDKVRLVSPVPVEQGGRRFEDRRGWKILQGAATPRHGCSPQVHDLDGLGFFQEVHDLGVPATVTNR